MLMDTSVEQAALTELIPSPVFCTISLRPTPNMSATERINGR